MKKLQTIILLFALALFAAKAEWTSSALADQVKKLPDYIDFSNQFRMFSGYLTLQLDPLINVHYLFITTMGKLDENNDDVVLWLNGGPGCSSLLGFTQQIGPNMLYSGTDKFADYFNPYSWNTKTNLLFFESPPGVGFSVNKDPNYVYNETRTASDNVAAIKAWFERFSNFKQNNFWITGESYCGMYIPYFSSAVIDANKNLPEDKKINLKGVMIGNGVMVTDKHWRREARNKFYSKHYFYGTQTENLIKNCQYNDSDTYNPTCIRGNQLADDSVVDINPYATTGICYTPKSTKIGSRRFYRTPFFEQNNPIMQVGSGSSPCTDDDGIQKYFNRADVKESLHVDLTIDWHSCNDFIGENYHKLPESISSFEKLKANNIKILLYSGNTDAIVSYVQTFEYINKIGWKKTKEQTPFVNERQSLMGWWVQYEGLTLSIINGAGHMVPSDKPHAAYKMFADFIDRK